MVMIFRSKKPRERLLREGEVMTFRLKPHYIGRDWMTDRRGGKKIVDIFIKLEQEGIPLNALGYYVSLSGFDSLDEWINEAKDLNKGMSNDKRGFLYFVKTAINRMVSE